MSTSPKPRLTHRAARRMHRSARATDPATPQASSSAPSAPAIPHSTWRDRWRRLWFAIRKQIILDEGETC